MLEVVVLFSARPEVNALIYEQNCIACHGDTILVREMHMLILWCINCGLRTETSEPGRVISDLEVA